ncbi:amino acid ABC transporter permease [Amycolatopsis pigmentata]|uniref:Amino acid ABC transporter permease n=1 Tax=Amycolatopsis pigmentata TaxID=450801 RepID=A0ABW5FL21_9PSEU
MTTTVNDAVQTETHTPGNLPVREPFHPWRWVVASAALIITGLIVRAFATAPNINWAVVRTYLFDGTILKGLELTIILGVAAQLLAIVLGVLLAVMRMSTNPVLDVISGFYVFIFRGMPGLLQILFWYNIALVFPRIGISIPFTSLGWSAETNTLITSAVAAVLGLGLNEAAYMCEIVRGGVDSVDPGQMEATRALGLRGFQRLRYVVLPQALRAIVPTTGNEFISMLKNTSLVSVIAAHELLTTAQTIYSRNFFTIELLLVASFWYLVVTTVATALQTRLERYLGRTDRHVRRSAWQLLLDKARTRFASRDINEVAGRTES